MKKTNPFIWLAIALIIISPFTPYLFTMDSRFNFDFSDTGEIGDTIGGITAPFINIAAAILVYLSFKEQIKANKFLSKESTYNYLVMLTDKINLEFKEFNKKSPSKNLLYHVHQITLGNVMINETFVLENDLNDISNELDFQVDNFELLIKEIKAADTLPILKEKFLKDIRKNLEQNLFLEIKRIEYVLNNLHGENSNIKFFSEQAKEKLNKLDSSNLRKTLGEIINLRFLINDSINDKYN